MLPKSQMSALWRSLRLHAGARDVAFSSRIILFLLKAWTNSGGRSRRGPALRHRTRSRPDLLPKEGLSRSM